MNYTTSTPDPEAVKEYYDERVAAKLCDFIDENPRIEAAVEAIAEWAPQEPKRVLEIGCGIGATCWRMAREWPDAKVIGSDISPKSIEVARVCFQSDNLSYYKGPLTEDTFREKFDFIVLMDTYEHIAIEDRPTFHTAIKTLLADEAKVFLSFPTPTTQAQPWGMQPVDEAVFVPDLIRLAKDTNTHLIYYREIGVWNYGDFAHAVLARLQGLAPVALRQRKIKGLTGLKHKFASLIQRNSHRNEFVDYLVHDAISSTRKKASPRFDVSSKERRRLVESQF